MVALLPVQPSDAQYQRLVAERELGTCPGTVSGVEDGRIDAVWHDVHPRAGNEMGQALVANLLVRGHHRLEGMEAPPVSAWEMLTTQPEERTSFLGNSPDGPATDSPSRIRLRKTEEVAVVLHRNRDVVLNAFAHEPEGARRFAVDDVEGTLGLKATECLERRPVPAGST